MSWTLAAVLDPKEQKANACHAPGIACLGRSRPSTREIQLFEAVNTLRNVLWHISSGQLVRIEVDRLVGDDLDKSMIKTSEALPGAPRRARIRRGHSALDILHLKIDDPLCGCRSDGIHQS